MGRLPKLYSPIPGQPGVLSQWRGGHSHWYRSMKCKNNFEIIFETILRVCLSLSACVSMDKKGF